jgi:hypothetical protein
LRYEASEAVLRPTVPSTLSSGFTAALAELSPVEHTPNNGRRHGVGDTRFQPLDRGLDRR